MSKGLFPFPIDEPICFGFSFYKLIFIHLMVLFIIVSLTYFECLEIYFLFILPFFKCVIG